MNGTTGSGEPPEDAGGNVAVLQDSDLSGEEMGELGAIVGGLIGLGLTSPGW